MMLKEAKGITLVELMVVVAIIAILAGITSLGGDLIRRERVASATRELMADLLRTRLNAMTLNSKGYGVRFESGTRYTMFEFDDCNDDHAYDISACGGAREESSLLDRPVPSGVVLASTSGRPFDNEVLLFDRFGRPRAKEWGFKVMTIVISAGDRALTARCVSVSVNRIRDGIWQWDDKQGKFECSK
jgi:prepilin-type N-terminal cleavage/methylation domain-containing protein